MTLPDWAKEIKKRLDAAALLPWNFDVLKHHVGPDDYSGTPLNKNTTAFIANSPQDIASLLEALEIAIETIQTAADRSKRGQGTHGYLYESLENIREIGEKK